MLKALNLILLLGLIFFFTRKKLSQFFKSQKTELEQTMAEAAEDLKQIEADHAEIKSKVEDLDGIISKLREEAVYDLDREKRKVKEETEAFAEKLRRDSELRMKQSFEKAIRQVERELLEIAMARSEQKLESKMKDEDPAWTAEMIQGESGENAGTSNYAS